MNLDDNSCKCNCVHCKHYGCCGGILKQSEILPNGAYIIEKKPYKCPVCEGKGTYLGIEQIPVQNCISCDGKGIV